MKVVLDPKFKENTITNIEDSSSEEDPRIKDMERKLDQTLENIKKGLKKC